MDTRFDELLEFPSKFPFRVMGLAEESLESRVIQVIQKHAPDDYTPKVKESSSGKYYSVAVNVTVSSKEQIESLYQALAELEGVRYVL